MYFLNDFMGYGVRVKEIMRRNPLAVRPEETVYKVIKKMRIKNAGTAIITDKKRHVLGIITEGDLLDKLIIQKNNPMKLSISQIMTRNVITTDPDTDLYKISKLMDKHKIKKLPIIENDKLVGIITRTDLSTFQPSMIDVLIEKLKIKEPSFKFSFWEK